MERNDFKTLKKIINNSSEIMSIKIWTHDGNVYCINKDTIKLTESQLHFKQRNKTKQLTYKQVGMVTWKK